MADDRTTPPRGYTTDEVDAERSTRPRRRHTGKKILGGLILIPLLVLALWIVVALNWSYSSGERGGYVQKFSKKGWLCKTWEGELAMVNIPGSMQQTFEFTVRNDSLAHILEQSVTSGARVALHYEQHVGIPFKCFGDTRYYVTEVRTAAPVPGPAPALPGPTAPAVPPATPPAATPSLPRP